MGWIVYFWLSRGVFCFRYEIQFPFFRNARRTLLPHISACGNLKAKLAFGRKEVTHEDVS